MPTPTIEHQTVVDSGNAASVDKLEATVTIPANVNLAVLTFSRALGGDPPVRATIAGVDATLLVQANDADNNCIWIYTLANPPTGADLLVEWVTQEGGSGADAVMVCSLIGLAGAGAVRDTDSEATDGTGTTGFTSTVTTLADDLVLSYWNHRSELETITADTVMPNRFSEITDGQGGVGCAGAGHSKVAAGASTSVEWAIGGTRRCAVATLSVGPAPEPPTPGTGLNRKRRLMRRGVR